MSTNQQNAVTVIGAIFRHRVLLVSIFVLTILLTLLFTLMQKKQYASELKVLVQNAREVAVVSANTGTTQTVGSGADSTDARVNSEIEILSDQDLMEHLATFRSQQLHEPAPQPGSRQMAAASGGVAGRLDVQPVKKSNVITLNYRDYSPELARNVLQELERFYLEKHVRISRPAGTFQFFSGEANKYNQQLSNAEKQLADFRTQNQFVALDKEKAALDDNLHGLEATSLSEEAQMRALTSQVAELSARLRSLQGRITTTVTSTPNQQGTQVLIGSLTDLRNRRITLLERFKPTDRLVQEIDEQIRNTEDSLTDLRAHEATTTATDNNPTVMTFKQQLETMEVQRAGVAESLRIHHLQQASYQERLDHLQQITPENDALERQVAEMRGLDQSVSDKRDAARMEDLLDAGQFGNVAVAQEPTYSKQKVKPRLSVNLMLGAVTGIFLCAATLLVLESTRGTVLSAADLEGISDAPVLATLPEYTSLGSILSPTGRSTTPTGAVLRPAGHGAS